MKVICTANQKGGVCKTTNSFHLLSYLAGLGHRVLGVDLDPQGHLSRKLLGGQGCSTAELFREKRPSLMVQSVTRADDQSGWSMTVDFTTSDPSLWSYLGVADRMGGHARLRQALENDERTWDFVVVDCPCGLNGFTNNGIAAADQILVPSVISLFSEDGLKEVLEYIQDMKESGINSKVEILGILINQFNPEAKGGIADVDREGYQMMRQKYESLVLPWTIPNSRKVEEAALSGIPVWTWNAIRKRAKDYSVDKIATAYERVMEDILRRVEGGTSGEGSLEKQDNLGIENVA